jgi:hypothetical protein
MLEINISNKNQEVKLILNGIEIYKEVYDKIEDLSFHLKDIDSTSIEREREYSPFYVKDKVENFYISKNQFLIEKLEDRNNIIIKYNRKFVPFQVEEEPIFDMDTLGEVNVNPKVNKDKSFYNYYEVD